MFSKILIANRGEIACRVAETARKLGIKTVAVYSEADTHAKHVAACDEAVLIGPAPAKESYLLGDKIIAVALATGAQAIHPGYGFLSENAGFAEACAKAGLVFIGPPASAIHAMGSKSAAKALMEKANVPLVPGYHGDNQDADFLQKEADRISYPVLLKASAGGGGKGMRIVEKSEDFKAALASCKREAINSFGDDKVLVERYLTRPRHIEIQVFADGHGECVYLFERDCSVQRRHQKVLEEAPAPGMSEERRRAMGDAAVAAAKAVGYVGAGTVEFIANQDGSFYFMEMNTRLQVEHPVTEMITGLDLVEWQLRVAFGEHLPLRQEQLQLNGHALEARIYAENPEKGFLPSIGTLRYLHTPPAVHFRVDSLGSHVQTPAAVRIDSGVREGDAISPFYDPMIAKLIVWGKDRDAALANMAAALAQYRIVGLATNIGFLQRLIAGKAFSTADLDTGLIERNHDALFPAPQPASTAALALATSLLLSQEAGRVDDVSDLWAQTSGWRMNGNLLRALQFADEAGDYRIELEYRGEQKWILHRDGVQHRLHFERQGDTELRVTLDDQVIAGNVVRDGDIFHAFHQGRHAVLTWDDPLAHAGHVESEGGRLTAPMPGKIVAVLVEKGHSVTKGAPLLIMEAMKMEHTIAAPADGVIDELLYAVGDQVTEGAQLLAFTPG
ncbi:MULTISPECIES: acetyl/propionyl/methylcrotonyl-CoA carboxylase subunit alpha [unclassified Herbaspirillum]|jgi:3-methylcrotonyl-CoA carboxylase alpha subunit|uniref:acetyl/propionyl/methylcrotonyl-CoA carboxylase subunit alpha n=1 Tax=unclassified Herbaspirillum TaxID=2624150 RepID=UPI000E2F0B6C|nr:MULTISPECIES: acetyl/propionyl/methylcrotonyl-CoA carboxylase subunit alpha [unclassified Herbaspirillum]RFB68103.1 acetyl/propionyl/methylcrotonyl-CoA carboxylase subunit alpha [Herbaspirillum sp. 3R-3a1]TFI06548.1 acetyl/propionyl/methylcrotonyl-CoA carboxylase subunit alpha [Herbaspirillum sp. 3R11]TFI13840.1 acetyl/propionyl/methylcrotonyl-CoA carboxylase subunit alpha [Herbaspirillum sp. 3R-11]TFI19661.1 acetyl/propionyl/methylcrotonyl-CoA carboxylase subunit alpha [Herbaspirillum sp. 3